MNIMGHAGITLGAVYVIGYGADALVAQQNRTGAGESKGYFMGLVSGRRMTPHRVDYRVIFIGSLLPDIIDKPLGFWLLPELVNHTTRGLAHGLAFPLGLLFLGLLFPQVNRFISIQLLALSCAGHIILDQMWLSPAVFLWPLYGWRLPPGGTTLTEWIGFQLSLRWVDPLGLIGGCILLWFFYQLIHHRALLKFLKSGAFR